MRALRPPLLPLLLLGAVTLLGCDRKTVLAGTYHREDNTTAEAGAGPGGAAGGSEPEIAGASGGGGMGGAASAPAPCVAALWYVPAQVVYQRRCMLERNDITLGLVRWLSGALPLPMTAGETQPFGPCQIELWTGMRTEVADDAPIVLCNNWCSHVTQSFSEEQQRLVECWAAGMQ